MRLLPDIRIGNSVLSIQYPYTIDGRLIVGIENNRIDYYSEMTYEELCGGRRIIFKTDDDRCYHFNLDTVSREYERVCMISRGRRFYNYNGTEIRFPDFNSYLSNISEQCYCLETHAQTLMLAQERNIYAEYIDILCRQHRSDRYTTITTINDDILFSHNDIASLLANDRSNLDTLSELRYYVSDRTKKENKYIHTYNYKPEYIKHYMPDEDVTTLLLGTEIEVDCGGESEEHAKAVLQIVCGVDEENSHENNDEIIPILITLDIDENSFVKLKDGYIRDSIEVYELYDSGALGSIVPESEYLISENNVLAFPKNTKYKKILVKYERSVECISDKIKEDKMYCMHDGSLKNGLEFATMPCSFEYHKNKMNYKEMFEYLDKNGYKAHDTTTCGLHIHANRSYLGKTELVQQLTISKILYILEKFNDEICVIARRNNTYSKFVGAGKDEKSIIELYDKYKNKDKYVALNLKHPDTIEFRCFRSTLKYETFILTLEFVKDIIDYAKSINIEDIELIKWTDLMNTFSDELKVYYNERLEKEKAKKETVEVKADVADAGSPNRNRSTLNFDGFSTGGIIGYDLNSSYALDNIRGLRSQIGLVD